MPSITQAMKYRESLLKYAEKHGTTKACAKYNVHRSYIKFWRDRWIAGDRQIKSLQERSRRPHSHSNQHTESELKLIKNHKRRNPNIGLTDLWLRLRAKGYTRTVQGLSKGLAQLGEKTNPKTHSSPTCKAKPYEQMTRPGERVQIDVKYVPKECIGPRVLEADPYFKLFQYTAIDEYSRLRILGGYQEHNTYSSTLFLQQAVSFYKAHGIEVECIQVDNGTEFTKRLAANDDNNLSMFELMATELNIRVKHIKPHTPKHNGKVERSHREDQKLFYSEVIRLGRPFKGLEDFKTRLKRHQDKTNARPMRPLGYLSPKEYLARYWSKR